ncbi:3982_t:CDS:1, partial [Cetraspora pellucida]
QKLGYLKTCNLCHTKLNLPSASASSSMTSNNNRETLLILANNFDQNDLSRNEITYSISIDNNLLNNIIEIDNIEDYVSTELEACENNENSTLGMELHLYINLSSEEFNESEDANHIFKRVVEAIQKADGYK